MRTARLKKSKTSSVASFTPQKWDQMFLYRCYTSVEDCSIPSKDDGLSSGGLSFGPVGANDEGQPLLRQEELCAVLAAASSGRQQLSVTWLHGWRMLCCLRCMRWILYTLIQSPPAVLAYWMDKDTSISKNVGLHVPLHSLRTVIDWQLNTYVISCCRWHYMCCMITQLRYVLAGRMLYIPFSGDRMCAAGFIYIRILWTSRTLSAHADSILSVGWCAAINKQNWLAIAACRPPHESIF